MWFKDTQSQHSGATRTNVAQSTTDRTTQLLPLSIGGMKEFRAVQSFTKARGLRDSGPKGPRQSLLLLMRPKQDLALDQRFVEVFLETLPV